VEYLFDSTALDANLSADTLGLTWTSVRMKGVTDSTPVIFGDSQKEIFQTRDGHSTKWIAS
jgi:hypothetical protein